MDADAAVHLSIGLVFLYQHVPPLMNVSMHTTTIVAYTDPFPTNHINGMLFY